MFCRSCFKNLSQPEKEKFKTSKKKHQQQRKKVAAKNRAKKDLRKALNDTKLKKIDSTVTSDSEIQND